MLSVLMGDLKVHSYCLARSRPPQNYKTVVIDPGHGGSDHGAIRGKVREKDLNLSVAKKLAILLKAVPNSLTIAFVPLH